MLLQFHAGKDVRHVIVDDVVVAVEYFALFSADNGGKSVAALERIADLVAVHTVGPVLDHVVLNDAASGIAQPGAEEHIVETDLETAEFDIRLMQRRCIIAVGILNTGICKGAQGAQFGLGASIETKFGARTGIPGLVFVGADRATGEDVIPAGHVKTQIPAHLEAGLGTGDIEEARAKGIANTNIFCRFGFGYDHRVS